ncbi:MAG: HEPN domain-containing protein [Negativicutes bacterium]
MKTVSEYLKSNRLKLATISSDMVRKELDVGRSDLAEAVDGLSRQAYKWTTIQAYYAIFHGMRALLFTAGLREESHLALKVAIQELYVATGKLSEDSYRALERGMELREMADYKSTFSHDTASWLVERAKTCLDEIEKLIPPT